MAEMTKTEYLYYVDIELAWEPYHIDFKAKEAQGRMGEWLFKYVGEMGNARYGLLEWRAQGWRWAWSLSCAKLQMPNGIYFLEREDATRFVLTFPDISRLMQRPL
jgi:hypothetical protein